MSGKAQNSLDNLARTVLLLSGERETIRIEVGHAAAEVVQQAIEMVQDRMLELNAQVLLEGLE